MNILSSSGKCVAAMIAALSMSASFACVCFFAGQFEDFAKQHPIVVRGTVLQHGEELPGISGHFRTMTVAVTAAVKGSFPHSTFDFYGDTGMPCLRYITLDDYPVGSEHLFIL